VSPFELWRFLPVGYLFTIAIETPILFFGLSSVVALAGFAGACSSTTTTFTPDGSEGGTSSEAGGAKDILSSTISNSVNIGQNAVLFSNLIPVTTFAIEIARGYRPNAAELLGAALTIGALVASNLLARRTRPSTAGDTALRKAELPEAA